MNVVSRNPYYIIGEPKIKILKKLTETCNSILVLSENLVYFFIFLYLRVIIL